MFEHGQMSLVLLEYLINLLSYSLELPYGVQLGG